MACKRSWVRLPLAPLNGQRVKNEPDENRPRNEPSHSCCGFRKILARQGLCHPEAKPKDLASEEVVCLTRSQPRSFTPLRSVQDDKYTQGSLTIRVIGLLRGGLVIFLVGVDRPDIVF